MQPLEQAVQRDETGAEQEDAVKSCAQRDNPARAWFKPVGLEASVEIPDQAAKRTDAQQSGQPSQAATRV